MFIRPCYKKSNGKKLAYWALMESYRTVKGPRQRVVAYLGQLQDATREGVKQAATGKNKPKFVQPQLFDEDTIEPEWVEVNANGVRVENEKISGGPSPCPGTRQAPRPRRFFETTFTALCELRILNYE